MIKSEKLCFSVSVVSNAPDKQFNDGICHGSQVIFSLGSQPVADGRFHCSENKTLDQTDIQIPAHNALFLSPFNDFRYNIQIHFGHFTDIHLHQFDILMGHGLIHNSHVSVFLKLFQMPVNQIPEFGDSIVRLFHRFPETGKNLFGFVGEKLNQNIVFVLEIQINGSIRNTGFASDLRNGCLMKTLFCKNAYGRLQYPVVFLACAIIVCFCTDDNLRKQPDFRKTLSGFFYNDPV